MQFKQRSALYLRYIQATGGDWGMGSLISRRAQKGWWGVKKREESGSVQVLSVPRTEPNRACTSSVDMRERKERGRNLHEQEAHGRRHEIYVSLSPLDKPRN